MTTCAGPAPSGTSTLTCTSSGIFSTALNCVPARPSLVSAVSDPSTQYKQPPGFKELRDQVAKFLGDSGEDFDVWLADY